MARESIRYKTASPPRKGVDAVPSSEKIKTMKIKADDEDDTQKPPQTQKGVPSPLRVLHKTPGLSPEEYKELLKKMSGPITASVINTYATFAELIVEKRGDTTKALRKRVEAQEDVEVDQSPIPQRGSPQAKTVAAQTRELAQGEPKPSPGHEMFMGGKGVESRSARASRRRTPGLSDLKKAAKLAKTFREIAKTGRKGTRMRDIKSKNIQKGADDWEDVVNPHGN